MRRVEFLDKDNFSATFRRGVWTLQHFHTLDSLRELMEQYFWDVKVYDIGASNIYAECRKPKLLSREQYEKCLNIEFNMEYPNGYHHNRHEKLVATILKKLEEERGLK